METIYTGFFSYGITANSFAFHDIFALDAMAIFIYCPFLFSSLFLIYFRPPMSVSGNDSGYFFIKNSDQTASKVTEKCP